MAKARLKNSASVGPAILILIATSLGGCQTPSHEGATARVAPAAIPAQQLPSAPLNREQKCAVAVRLSGDRSLTAVQQAIVIDVYRANNCAAYSVSAADPSPAPFPTLPAPSGTKQANDDDKAAIQNFKQIAVRCSLKAIAAEAIRSDADIAALAAKGFRACLSEWDDVARLTAFAVSVTSPTSETLQLARQTTSDNAPQWISAAISDLKRAIPRPMPQPKKPEFNALWAPILTRDLRTPS